MQQQQPTPPPRQTVVLMARGRVSLGGRRAALDTYLVRASATDMEDIRVECVDRQGFSARVMVPDTLARGEGGGVEKQMGGRRSTIRAHQVHCVLGDGTALACEGYWQDGQLRLDAVDQDNHYWIWLEVSATRRLLLVPPTASAAPAP